MGIASSRSNDILLSERSQKESYDGSPVQWDRRLAIVMLTAGSARSNLGSMSCNCVVQLNFPSSTKMSTMAVVRAFVKDAIP